MGEVEALLGGMELGASLLGGSAIASGGFVAPFILLVNSRQIDNTWNDSREIDNTWVDSREIDFND